MRLLIFVTLCLLNLHLFSQRNLPDLRLWYKEPAKIWEEALPVGNGKIGAMVFGHPTHERIQLNDDSLWPDNLDWNEPAGTPEDLEEIRRLLMEGKAKEADQLMVQKFSNLSIVRSHQTLGDLYFDWEHKDISDYKRELDLNAAVTSTSYLSEGYQVNQKVFASFPDQCMVIQLTSEHPDGLNGVIRLTRPLDNDRPTAITMTNAQNQLVMKGEVTQLGGRFRSKPFPIESGVKFETILNIEHEGGRIIRSEDQIRVENTSRIVLIIVNSTSFYDEDYSARNSEILDKVKGKGIDELLARKCHPSFGTQLSFI